MLTLTFSFLYLVRKKKCIGCRKISIIVWIKLLKLQCELPREYKLSRVPELVDFKLMHEIADCYEKLYCVTSVTF